MKKLIIAMKDKHQSERLAIALSSSYESIIVDSATKLRNMLEIHLSDYYTVIYEEIDHEDNFFGVLTDLQENQKLQKKTIQIVSKESDIKDSESRIILTKPFDVKKLVQKLNKVDLIPVDTSTASA